MSTFSHKGKEIELWGTSGEVISSSKHAETYVSSSGGGGYIGPHGGVISSPSISSQVVTKHEFWLKAEDNSEIPIQLTGLDIPLKEGQKVTMVGAAIKGATTGDYIAIINHSANRFWRINSAMFLNRKYKLEKIGFRPLLIALILFFAMAYSHVLAKNPLEAGGYTADAGYYGKIYIAESFTHKLTRHASDIARQVGMHKISPNTTIALSVFTLVFGLTLRRRKVGKVNTQLDAHITTFIGKRMTT